MASSNMSSEYLQVFCLLYTLFTAKDEEKKTVKQKTTVRHSMHTADTAATATNAIEAPDGIAEQTTIDHYATKLQAVWRGYATRIIYSYDDDRIMECMYLQSQRNPFIVNYNTYKVRKFKKELEQCFIQAGFTDL